MQRPSMTFSLFPIGVAYTLDEKVSMAKVPALRRVNRYRRS